LVFSRVTPSLAEFTQKKSLRGLLEWVSIGRPYVSTNSMKSLKGTESSETPTTASDHCPHPFFIYHPTPAVWLFDARPWDKYKTSKTRNETAQIAQLKRTSVVEKGHFSH